jgi:hypothetical protein
MTPIEIVDTFAALAARCLDQLRSTYDGIERTAVDLPAQLLPKDGSAPVRRGQLGTLGRFELHGRGCRFELPTGEDLDIDWDSDGRAVFDSWRILMFARSIGESSVDRDSLRRAALEATQLWQVQEDWFTWADRNYDLGPGGG